MIGGGFRGLVLFHGAAGSDSQAKPHPKSPPEAQSTPVEETRMCFFLPGSTERVFRPQKTSPFSSTPPKTHTVSRFRTTGNPPPTQAGWFPNHRPVDVEGHSHRPTRPIAPRPPIHQRPWHGANPRRSVETEGVRVMDGRGERECTSPKSVEWSGGPFG